MKRILGISVIMLAAALPATAQRHITPVDNPVTATKGINVNPTPRDTINRDALVEMTDSRGNKLYIDTITGREVPDSLLNPSGANTSRIPKMQQPLLHSASVWVDVFQGAMRLFGQTYGLAEAGIDINLHNRYMPTLEVGLGQASHTPEDNNYSYHTPVAPFFRIGVNYNFLYNSNPDYLLMAGLRYGFSPFKFSVTDITQGPGYWDEPLHYDIASQNVTAGYLQLSLGLRVRISGPLSLGWSVRYQSILHGGDSPHGPAWYIPGYGSRSSHIGASFVIVYTMDFRRPAPQEAAP